MTGVVIRQAGRTDAPLVAALVLQAARAEGLKPQPGFFDQYAQAWLASRDHHPAWWAESGGEHAGVLVGVRTFPLPWPGRTPGGTLRKERLFVRADQPVDAIAAALRTAAKEWAAARAITDVRLD